MDKVNWNKLSQRAYNNAVKHGLTGKYNCYYDLMMIVTELAEAVNADKKGKSADRLKFEKSINNQPLSDEHWKSCFEEYIKDSVEDELVDALIYMMTYSIQWNDPIDTYLDNDNFMARVANLMKKKKHFPIQVFSIVENLNNTGFVDIAALRLIGLCNHLQIDLLWHIEQKMKYNEMRPFKHGKKY